ncbi:hypothetical protein AB0D04_04045 [Streptomyces sp. NPDC048483]|uniref:hypothetical protein n=1 Tax=Streptomyces sp. NPDC048483 TaxID=3154927 RepID=UPI003445CBE3
MTSPRPSRRVDDHPQVAVPDQDADLAQPLLVGVDEREHRSYPRFLGLPGGEGVVPRRGDEDAAK